MNKRRHITIKGQIQGVGFRPAVFRLAEELDLSGFVLNTTSGVTIEIQGTEERIDEFLKRLRGKDLPALAQIDSVRAEQVPLLKEEKRFTIRESLGADSSDSRVTVDTAVCKECIIELNSKEDLRYQYPFINCTNCGPRYSIIKEIPYDRPKTTMSSFDMCPVCRKQYTDPSDRRFHAQPVACPACGPRLFLTDRTGKIIEEDSQGCITRTAEVLREGGIAAVKGVGGFHLAVDALNEQAVQRLRRRKKRDHKPFAMMANSIGTIKKYAILSEHQRALLESPQAPIVILPQKDDSDIAPSVAEGTDSYGFMLCYAPVHHLLFQHGLELVQQFVYLQ